MIISPFLSFIQVFIIILIMKGQIKVKQKAMKQQALMVAIHPELKVKEQLAKMIESKFSKTPASPHQYSSQINSCLVQNLQHLDSVPYSSFKKYQQSTPRRSPRKKIKVSLQKMQENQGVRPRLLQWKEKILNKGIENEKREKFNKTNSSSQFKDIQKIYRFTPFDTISPSTAQSRRNKGYNEGQQRMVGNNSYMRKLRIKIEFYSLASFTQRQTPSNSFSPNVKTIEPLSNRNRLLEPPKKGLSSTFTRKINGKCGKIGKCEEKLRFQPFELGSFRPWSGMQPEFINEISHESI